MAPATFLTTEEQDVSGTVTATDPNGDALTFAVVTAPARGVLVSFTSGGAFTYRPNTNAFGTDTFTVSVSDGRGGTVNATMTVNVTNVNDPPAASNDRIELAPSATLSVDVLANDSDPDNDALTVSITEAPFLGTATVAANNTVSLTGLPAGFRGFTHFRYRVTDSSGVTSDAVANVFVGVAPYRAILKLQGPTTASFRIGITDFTGEPRVLNAVEPPPMNTVPLSMRPSANGATVAYYRQLAGGGPQVDWNQLCFVHTAVGSTPHCYAIPDDRTLFMLPPNKTSFVYAISPDGRWVAAVLAHTNNTFSPSLFVFDVNAPTVAIPVVVAGAEHGVLPRFSADSQYLYFIGNDALGNDGLGIYRQALGSAQAPLRLTAPESQLSRIDGYAVSPDGSRVVFQRVSGDPGVWFVDTTTPGQEHRLSHTFVAGESIQWRQGSPAIANPDVNTVAYVIWRADNTRDIWMADVSSTAPNPHLVATVPNDTNITVWPSVRPDGGAVLYTYGTGSSFNDIVYEAAKTPAAPQPVATSLYGTYDASGDRFILSHGVLTPTFDTIYDFRTVTRSALGTTPLTLGTPGQQSVIAGGTDYSPHGAIIIGESDNGFSNIRPMLVNFAAPAVPFPLSSEVTLTTGSDGPSYYLVD